jgi:hypothetical protein
MYFLSTAMIARFFPENAIPVAVEINETKLLIHLLETETCTHIYLQPVPKLDMV